MTTPKSTPASLVAGSTYPFGERASALIGVRLNSKGDLDVFARSRSDVTKPMTSLLSVGPVNVGAADVEFTFRLAKPHFGLFTVEAAGWVKAYEINRAHFLGYPAPFSIDELEYDAGHTNPAFEANREFTCTYSANGLLKIRDGLGSDYEEIKISSLDGTGGVIYTGKVFVVIRVTAAYFQPKCASLTFKNFKVGGSDTFELSP
jgi:hypothetical protein